MSIDRYERQVRAEREAAELAEAAAQDLHAKNDPSGWTRYWAQVTSRLNHGRNSGKIKN